MENYIWDFFKDVYTCFFEDILIINSVINIIFTFVKFATSDLLTFDLVRTEEVYLMIYHEFF